MRNFLLSWALGLTVSDLIPGDRWQSVTKEAKFFQKDQWQQREVLGILRDIHRRSKGSRWVKTHSFIHIRSIQHATNTISLKHTSASAWGHTHLSLYPSTSEWPTVHFPHILPFIKTFFSQNFWQHAFFFLSNSTSHTEVLLWMSNNNNRSYGAKPFWNPSGV